MVEFSYEINRPVTGTHVFARILNHEDLTILSTGDCDVDGALDRQRAPGRYRTAFRVPTELLNDGEYSIAFALGVPFASVYDSVASALSFNVRGDDGERGPGYFPPRPGMIVRDIEWTTQSVGISG